MRIIKVEDMYKGTSPADIEKFEKDFEQGLLIGSYGAMPITMTLFDTVMFKWFNLTYEAVGVKTVSTHNGWTSIENYSLPELLAGEVHREYPFDMLEWLEHLQVDNGGVPNKDGCRYRAIYIKCIGVNTIQITLLGYERIYSFTYFKESNKVYFISPLYAKVRTSPEVITHSSYAEENLVAYFGPDNSDRVLGESYSLKPKKNDIYYAKRWDGILLVDSHHNKPIGPIEAFQTIVEDIKELLYVKEYSPKAITWASAESEYVHRLELDAISVKNYAFRELLLARRLNYMVDKAIAHAVSKAKPEVAAPEPKEEKSSNIIGAVLASTPISNMGLEQYIETGYAAPQGVTISELSEAIISVAGDNKTTQAIIGKVILLLDSKNQIRASNHEIKIQK